MASKVLPLVLLGGAALLVMGKKKKATIGTPPVPVPNGDGGTASKEVWKDRQRALGFLGYEVGKIDGIYGPVTENALKEFQADNGLPQTGVWNKATADTMRVVGLQALREMAWDKLRELWNYYFPQWGEAGAKDEQIGFDKLFDKLTEIVT